MTKKEILEKIKSYNKSILLLRLEEKRNQLTTNFDEANARAEAISNARDAESETIKSELLKYFKNYDLFYNGKHKNELTIKELIELANNFKKPKIKA
jgi:hypothetical protein